MLDKNVYIYRLNSTNPTRKRVWTHVQRMCRQLLLCLLLPSC